MCRYIRQNLVAGEYIVYHTRLHWITFVSWKGLLSLFIVPFIEYITNEFAITNQRVIIKVGFISRRIFEINIDKIESIYVNQNLWGRIFGYGTVVITGSGGTKDYFHNISNPLEFRNRVQEILTER